jgi:hypothetical protein
MFSAGSPTKHCADYPVAALLLTPPLFTPPSFVPRRWLNRYEKEVLKGLLDRAKSGRPVASEKEVLKKI